MSNHETPNIPPDFPGLDRGAGVPPSWEFQLLFHEVTSELMAITEAVTHEPRHEEITSGSLCKRLGPYEVLYHPLKPVPEGLAYTPVYLRFAFGGYEVHFWSQDYITIEDATPQDVSLGLIVASEVYKGVNLAFDEEVLRALLRHLKSERKHLEGHLDPLLEAEAYGQLLKESWDHIIL